MARSLAQIDKQIQKSMWRTCSVKPKDPASIMVNSLAVEGFHKTIKTGFAGIQNWGSGKRKRKVAPMHGEVL